MTASHLIITHTIRAWLLIRSDIACMFWLGMRACHAEAMVPVVFRVNSDLKNTNPVTKTRAFQTKHSEERGNDDAQRKKS